MLRGESWWEVAGSFCTSCGAKNPVSVDRSRCRPCYERFMGQHEVSEGDDRWYAQSGHGRMELWTSHELSGGSLWADDRSALDAVERRWPFFMRGAPVLRVIITSPSRQRMDPLRVAIGHGHGFGNGYERIVIERNSSTKHIPCDAMPTLADSNHIVYAESDVHSWSKWDLETTLASWEYGIARDNQNELPMALMWPTLFRARTLICSEAVPVDEALLALDVTLGLPESDWTRRWGICDWLVNWMLAALHTYDESELRGLLAGGDAKHVDVIVSALTGAAPLGAGEIRRTATGTFSGFGFRRDRLASIRVMFFQADQAAVVGRAAVVTPIKVH